MKKTKKEQKEDSNVVTSSSTTSSSSSSPLPPSQFIEGRKNNAFASTKDIDKQIASYRSLCDKYGVKPSGSFMVALRRQLPTLKFTADSGVLMEDQLLPICDFYLDVEAGQKRFFPKKWDFSGCSIASNGVALIASLLRAQLPMYSLKMKKCNVGPRGFDFISEALEEGLPPTLRHLDLSDNLAYSKAAMRFCRALELGRHSLEKFEASNSRLTFYGVKGIENVVKKINEERVKQHSKVGELQIELYGNLVVDEVWNSITHGVGFILAIIGTIFLMYTYSGRSIYHTWGCAVFGFSMIILYFSSFFYHCFFKVLPAKNVFHRFDRFSIYFLIAGSYTPICLISLHGRIGFLTVGAVWTLALVGLILDIFFFGRFQRLKLSLYLIMGWLCALVALPIITHPNVPISTGMFLWLLAGGLCYTGGVFFFVKDDDHSLYHAYWHVCVLFGTVCHYIVMYCFVMPGNFPNPPVDKFFYSSGKH